MPWQAHVLARAFCFDSSASERITVDQPLLSPDRVPRCRRRHTASRAALPSAENATRFKLVHERNRVTRRRAENLTIVLPCGLCVPLLGWSYSNNGTDREPVRVETSALVKAETRLSGEPILTGR